MEQHKEKTQEEQKISHLLTVILVFLALLFLSSCGNYLPQPQEMGNMALLRSFALDKGEEENALVTVSTGKQATGLSGNQEAPTILQGESLTFQGACDRINGFSEHYVFYGYIDQLILGKEVAEEGVLHILEYFTTNPQLSLGTGIWLSQGRAEDILYHTEEDGAAEHLHTITQESDLGIGGMTRKAGEVLAELKEHQASYIPILTTDSQGTLRETGYGLIEEENLVGIVQGALAQGLELLECHEQLQELEYKGEGYALALSQMKKNISAQWGGNMDQNLLSIHISLEMEGEWMKEPEEQEQVLHAMEEKVEALLLGTAKEFQRKQTDILNFSGELALCYPQHSQYLKENWAEVFPTTTITTSATINMEQTLGGDENA